MSVLERKLVRDLRRLRGQVITIAAVLTFGIMAMVMLQSTWASLIESRDRYYAQARFGQIFARLERAPETVVGDLERIPGVAEVYARVVEDVMLPLETVAEPIPGRIVSIPADGEPPLGDVILRAGRMPDPAADDEALALEKFAVAHKLQPGDSLPVVVNGSLRRLRIVGFAMSPEYVFAMAGYEMVADPDRFVVLWMPRPIVAPMFRMEGAFNDVVARLEPGASEQAVIPEIDHVLAPYGGLHAVGRDRQLSHYALSNELAQLRSLALMIPLVFLAVAAFLVNVVVSRLVFLERTQIAVLKALGYRDGRIALHYLGLVALIVALAAAFGVWFGVVSGRWMTGIYTEFFSFPGEVFRLDAGLVVMTVGVALAAAVTGAVGAVRRVARLPPAEAMLPPAPLSYRRSWLDRLGLGHAVGPAAMMVVREIRRRPLRFSLSTLGIAMGVAIFIMGRFSWDSFSYLMDEVFLRQQRGDLVVTLVGPRPERVVRELEHLPGVERAEGNRVVPIRLRVGHRFRDAALHGLPPAAELRTLLHAETTVVPPPPQGVILTDRLAEILGVRVGDEVTVELLQGDFATRAVPVTGLIDEPFGLQAYARTDWLARLLREEPRVDVIHLRIDPPHVDEVRARLKEMPAVLAVTSTASMKDAFEDQTGESVGMITLILTLSAAAIAVGVVYNNARIALSMRSRDLASLRVLGFTRREISTILIGELGVQVAVGIPLGLVIGRLWAGAIAASFSPEAMRFPLHITDRTYATAALIALISGLVSALLVRRKLDQLDLVGVLKAD